MSKKNIAKNYLYNLGYQILALILPLITTPYLSRVLGAENIGIYSYTLSITTYFILFGSLGVSMYGQREIAYVQDDLKKRSCTFFEIFIMKCITLSISLGMFYLSFCLDGQYHLYYRILILEIIANIVDISWYFQGLEEFKKTVIRNSLVKLISVVCIFLFVKSSNDLSKYFVIYALSTFLGNLSLWIYMPRYVKMQKLKSLNIKRHIKPAIMLFIPQIATQVYTVLDKTMIGAIVIDKSEVGYYEQAQKIVKLLLTLATSLGTVMMPRIASTFARGNRKKVKEYMNKSFAFIMMIAMPLTFGIISTAHNFVPLFYGPGYEKVTPLLCVISPIIILIGLSNVTGTQYLLPTKQQNKYTISVIIGATINFILNFILIKKYASLGASIATVFAEFSVTLVQFILIRKEIKMGDIIKMTYKYLISSIIMFYISMLVSHFITNNLLSILVQVAISIISYFGVLILLKDKMIIEGINLLRQKLKVSK